MSFRDLKMPVIIANSLQTAGQPPAYPQLEGCRVNFQAWRLAALLLSSLVENGGMYFSHWFRRLSHQISDIQVNGQSDDMTAKEKLLLWSQRMVEGYQGLRCDNFTSSWRDGKLFNAIIHKHRWDTVPLH